MFVVFFNFRKKKTKKKCVPNWFFAPIPMLSRIRYYMTNNSLGVNQRTRWLSLANNKLYRCNCCNHYHHLVHRSTQCSISQWCPQTNFAQQGKTVHLLFNTSKFYKTVILQCFCPTYTDRSPLILHFTSVDTNISEENNCVKKTKQKLTIKK